MNVRDRRTVEVPAVATHTSPEHLSDRVRSPASWVALGCSVLLFGVVGLLVSDGDVGLLESAVFHLSNGLPTWLGPPLIVVMQLGWLPTVLVVGAVLVVARRPRLALDVVAAGALAYLAVMVAKPVFGRGRPADLLTEVVDRGTFDAHAFGFPSGHVAVAAALVAVLAPYVPRRLRGWWWALVPLVMVARMYVGAHLPLDTVGGLLVGVAAASVVHLVLGVKDPARDVPALTRRLTEGWPEVRAVVPVDGDARASVPYLVSLADGSTLFLKASSRTNLFVDQVRRIARRAFFARSEDLAPYLSTKQKVDHEAFMLLMAQRAGVRVPAVVDVAYDASSGAVLLLQQRVVGRSLDALRPDEVSPEVLRRAFRELAALHRARIAHRDLRPANLVLDDDGDVFLIDFGSAETSASPRQLRMDAAELLMALSMLADPATVVDAFLDVFTPEDLAALDPYLQPLTLGSTTRNQLRRGPDPIPALSARAAELSGSTTRELERLPRVTRLQVLALLGALVAIHFLLPQVGELTASVAALRAVDPLWVGVALLASAGTYLAAGYNQRTASEVDVPYGPMVAAQLAASFMNRFTPVSVGSVVMSSRVMVRHGMESGAALAVAGLPGVVGLLTSTVVMLAVSPGSVAALSGRLHVTRDVAVLLAVMAVSALLGLLVYPLLRHRIMHVVASAWRGLTSLRSPARAARLTIGCLLVTSLYVASLWSSLHALGASVSPLHVFVVFFAGSLIGQASPVPGGLGATEAALVAGLTFFGVGTSVAIGAVLVHRLATFWLPTIPGAFAMRWMRGRHYL